MAVTQKPAYATRESILNYVDFQTREIAIPEWGGMVVKIRSMSARERDMLESPMIEAAAAGKDAKFSNFRARIVALVCINEDGSKMFTIEDVEALGDKNSGAISRIADEAISLNGINEEDAAKLGKGLGVKIGSDSGSSSPEPST